NSVFSTILAEVDLRSEAALARGYSDWCASCTRTGHDESGFDSIEASLARVPSLSPAPRGRCGLPPHLLDRFWTIIHTASLNPANWPQRSSPSEVPLNGAERLRWCFRDNEVLRPESCVLRKGSHAGRRTQHAGPYNRRPCRKSAPVFFS